MEVTVWRISPARHSKTLFSGAGAEMYGGRFNSPGRKVVYTSGSLSLAMLELLVQGNKRDRFIDLIAASVTFDSDHVTHLEPADLPSDWTARPPKSSSQFIGDDWLENETSLVLRVPSVIVPSEYNYLINPRRPPPNFNMPMNAQGQFDITMAPMTDSDYPAGRMTISKTYNGDLVGSGTGQMISKRTESGSAMYFAIEEFEGTLYGKSGGFTLMHRGKMNIEMSLLDIIILEGSGYGELAGITGTCTIIRHDGSHSYEMEYELESA